MTEKQKFISKFIIHLNKTKFKDPCRHKKAKEKDIEEYKLKIIDLAYKAIKGNYGKRDNFWNQWYFEGGYLSSSLWGQLDFIFDSPYWFTHNSKKLNDYYIELRKMALGKEVIDDTMYDALLYLKKKAGK